MRTRIPIIRLTFAAALMLICSIPAASRTARAPDWMHALVSAPLPPHDEKDDAVILYRSENVDVISTGKFRRTVQVAYKILRPEGRDYGLVQEDFSALNEKVTSIKGWCIPADGKDYEVTEKDAVEIAYLKDESFVLETDEKVKALQIPAPEPGNIIGYEVITEEKPFVLQDSWEFQDRIPVRETHYSVTLPEGWEYRDAWANYPEQKEQNAAGGQIEWALSGVGEVRKEAAMPAFSGVAGRMVITLFPPGGSAKTTLPTWSRVGQWVADLTSGRTDASPEIKQQVQALTASAPTPLAKMQAIAKFIQSDIRYVAIELGIGGYQPHTATDVYAHHYGDCKDKATLTISMLHQIGIQAYYVIINVERGSVTSNTPPNQFVFDHAIVAVQLPDSIKDPSLVATIKHPTLGTVLFFDPTNTKTPFGEIGSYLQANYGLLVAPPGGELVELPQQVSTTNGIERTAKLTLTGGGILRGTVHEVRVGDRAWDSREMYSMAQKSTDKIRPVEQLLSDSLSSFQIGNATIGNPLQTDLPFVWDYTFQADNYAKFAGDMLLVRPRVLGRKERATLETAEPRRYPIEFDDGPVLDTDTFEITLPKGYIVDDIPAPVDVDYDFASYHSKTEVEGNVLRYHRTFEEKELSVPVNKADQLKKFYRIVASDERNTAVLKLAPRP